MPAPTDQPTLQPYGWDERVATLFASEAAEGTVPARVVRVDRDRVLVRDPDGDRQATADTLPAVGDWVALRLGRDDDGAQTAHVETVLPRRSHLERHAAGEVTLGQVLAANVDLVLVVSPLDRGGPNLNRIERELVIAWDGGARPVVILTKADTSPDPEADAAEVLDRLVGVDVVLTSAETGQGIDAVAELLHPNLTAVLLGASGAGKSTLANALLGREELDTGEVRQGDHRGRHTTTARHLVTVPGGGVLIDTPGIRSVGLWEAVDGLALTFPDIDEAAADCRFRDCRHAGEPGCAVVESVDPARLESYRKLEKELEHVARSQDARAKAERDRKWKIIHKAHRKNPSPKR